ncbi:N-alpha-acetyl-L-2,4-diaminobutyrate deacetylase [Limimonas halophila]|uniref:N-alpha-acetyl-L-2,4-diaminobutyrate deacetylase n=1 Tax=Limimonas halophila TaxID=1082479 RepID=A0A1G7LKW9_9PROT|nr:succinylglutamate desuccinylase/aspartoacylase family protein [Limimonas halophila]SDF50071.1 N-alpha-acetyl-L-2,4-diaminobutyrate deacetylase [Limimonas halophila]
MDMSASGYHPYADELPPRVTATVDWSAEGKQHGHLNVPYSSNESAWGAVRVPITLIQRFADNLGNAVMLTGGNHGDEFEGPIALSKLARELRPEDVNGRVIIIPALNPPAVRAATRVSPLDGVNMNRAFPGARTGTVTQMICHYVTSTLLPMVDGVLDLHAGGKTLSFEPLAAMHYLHDQRQFQRNLDTLKAINAPHSLIIDELDAEGEIDGVVEGAGKVFVFTELGGGGTATPNSIALAERCARNMLNHFEITQADGHGSPAAQPRTRMMDTPDANSYVIADDNGLLEPLVDLGEQVEAGQPVARIHNIEKTAAEPAVYHAGRSGMLIGRRWPGVANSGDCLGVIAIDTDR